MVMLFIPHSAVSKLRRKPFYFASAALMLLNIDMLTISGKRLDLLKLHSLSRLKLIESFEPPSPLEYFRYLLGPSLWQRQVL